MKAVVITIGDELLIGQVLDTNSCWIARTLTASGLEVVEMLTVRDGEREIREAVSFSMEIADITVVTGGLGPTKDDITKKVIADYFGSPLSFHEETADFIENMLRNRGVPMNASNREQAVLPDNCLLIKNTLGTASGMWFERDGRSLISLPGVPFEMKRMMTEEVLPRIKERIALPDIGFRVLKLFHVPESVVSEDLDSWERELPEGISLAYLPSPGDLVLRLTARGKAALERLDEMFDSLKIRLGDRFFVEGETASLEGVLAGVLTDKKLTVSCAESCTGGYIAHLMTSVPGASLYFKGGFLTYSDALKIKILGVKEEDIATYGAVSETVVKQMAVGARILSGTDYAVATSGIAGPGGGSREKPVGTVWVALAGPDGVEARLFRLSFTRERNIAKASLLALDMLYRKILSKEP